MMRCSCAVRSTSCKPARWADLRASDDECDRCDCYAPARGRRPTFSAVQPIRVPMRRSCTSFCKVIRHDDATLSWSAGLTGRAVGLTEPAGWRARWRVERLCQSRRQRQPPLFPALFRADSRSCLLSLSLLSQLKRLPEMQTPPLSPFPATVTRRRRVSVSSSLAPGTVSTSRPALAAPQLNFAHRLSSSSLLPTIPGRPSAWNHDALHTALPTNQPPLTAPLSGLPAQQKRKAGFLRKLFGGASQSAASAASSDPTVTAPITIGLTPIAARPKVDRKVSFSTLTIPAEEHSLRLPPARLLPAVPINMDLEIKIHRPSLDLDAFGSDSSGASGGDHPNMGPFQRAEADGDGSSLLFAPTPCSTPSSRSASSESSASAVHSMLHAVSDRLIPVPIGAGGSSPIPLRRFPSAKNRAQRGRQLTRDEHAASNISRETGRWLIGGLFAPRTRSESQQSEPMLERRADSGASAPLATSLMAGPTASVPSLLVAGGMGAAISRRGSVGGFARLELTGLELVGSSQGGLGGWLSEAFDEI